MSRDYSSLTVKDQIKVKYVDMHNPLERIEQQRLLQSHKKKLNEIYKKGARAISNKAHKYAGSSPEIT